MRKDGSLTRPHPSCDDRGLSEMGPRREPGMRAQRKPRKCKDTLRSPGVPLLLVRHCAPRQLSLNHHPRPRRSPKPLLVKALLPILTQSTDLLRTARPNRKRQRPSRARRSSPSTPRPQLDEPRQALPTQTYFIPFPLSSSPIRMVQASPLTSAAGQPSTAASSSTSSGAFSSSIHAYLDGQSQLTLTRLYSTPAGCLSIFRYVTSPSLTSSSVLSLEGDCRTSRSWSQLKKT